MEQPRGQAVKKAKKGINIKNFVKSQPLFDVHQQYLQTFLIDLQALSGAKRYHMTLKPTSDWLILKPYSKVI